MHKQFPLCQARVLQIRSGQPFSMVELTVTDLPAPPYDFGQLRWHRASSPVMLHRLERRDGQHLSYTTLEPVQPQWTGRTGTLELWCSARLVGIMNHAQWKPGHCHEPGECCLITWQPISVGAPCYESEHGLISKTAYDEFFGSGLYPREAS